MHQLSARHGAQGSMMETTQYSKHLFHHPEAELIHPVLSFFSGIYTLPRRLPASQRPWQNPIPPRYHVKPHNFQLSLSKLDCEVLQRKGCLLLFVNTLHLSMQCLAQSRLHECMLDNCTEVDWNYGWENVVIIQYLWNNSWWVQMMKERGKSG